MKKSIFMSDIARIFTVVIFMVQYAAGVEITSWMTDMLNSVNSERAKRSLNPLCYNEKIIAAAVAHNKDMGSNDFFDHTGFDGSKPWDRVGKEDYSWNSVAENIAWGQTSVQEVMKVWMNSDGHKKNILSEKSAHFGAAWDDSSNIWTQVFARSNSSSEMCISVPTKPPKEVGEACENEVECKSNKCKKGVCKIKKKKKKNDERCNKNSKCISGKCYRKICRPNNCLDKRDACANNLDCCSLRCDTEKSTCKGGF